MHVVQRKVFHIYRAVDCFFVMIMGVLKSNNSLIVLIAVLCGDFSVMLAFDIVVLQKRQSLSI